MKFWKGVDFLRENTIFLATTLIKVIQKAQKLDYENKKTSWKIEKRVRNWTLLEHKLAQTGHKSPTKFQDDRK